MIRRAGQVNMSAAPGGGTRFGSSVTPWPSSGSPNALGTPGAGVVTVVTVITMGSGSVTFTPMAGYTLVHTERVLQAGAAASPFGESYTGSNPCYMSLFTCVASGVQSAFTGTFSAGTYYSAIMTMFTGVDLASPVVGTAGTHRTFVGTNNPSYAWTSTFADTVTVGGTGAGFLTVLPGNTSAMVTRYPSGSTPSAAGPMPVGTGGSYTVTQATYSGGSGVAVLVKLREAPPPHCSEFIAEVSDVVSASNVQLSVASSSLPDPLSSYQIAFYGNTTGNATPAGGSLSGGPWTIGPMAAGTKIDYIITRVDGAHIDGSCVMRATDTAFGLTWDVTVRCPGISWGFNLSFGQRGPGL